MYRYRSLLGHSERVTRSRAVDFARWIFVAVLAVAAVAVGLLTESGYYEYVGGGDCGGTSCIDDGQWKGFRIVLVLLAAAVFLGSWPRMVQRYRRVWDDK